MQRPVVAFGEVLWDLFPSGPVLGGAPFNFIYRMAELGHEGVMISAIGKDELGRQAVNAIEASGVSSTQIQHVERFPTGTVDIKFDEKKQPHYVITQGVAYDHIALTSSLEALVARAGCLCFGTLAQRHPDSRRTLSTLLDSLEATESGLRFLDINLRKDCFSLETIRDSLRRADIVKLNDTEAVALAEMFSWPEREASAVLSHLIEAWDLLYGVVTLGEQGALCQSRDGRRVYEPGYEIDLIDPCGSGDAFAAGFLDQILRGHSMEQGCRLGNILGALVATQRGATRPVTSQMITQFRNEPPYRVVNPAFTSFITQTENYPLWTN